VDNSYKWAGGGFVSTAHDLVRFGSAHLQAKALTRQTLDLFWTPQKTNDGVKTSYGIGWFLGEDDDGRSWVGHGGGSVGGTTYFRMYPEEEFVLVIIANMSRLDYAEFPSELVQLFLK
jgi:CubicO group peptidase (beta-lactamase class C family)